MNGKFGDVSFKKILALLSTGVTLLTLPACTMKKESKENIIDNINITEELVNEEQLVNIDDTYESEIKAYDEYGNTVGREIATFDINDRVTKVSYNTGWAPKSWSKEFTYDETGFVTDVSFYDSDGNLISVDKESNYIYENDRLVEVNYINDDGKILDNTKITYNDNKIINIKSDYNNPYYNKQHTFDKEFCYDEAGLNKINNKLNGEISTYIDKVNTYNEDGQIMQSTYSNENNRNLMEVNYNVDGYVDSVVTLAKDKRIKTSSENDIEGISNVKDNILQTKYDSKGNKLLQTAKYYYKDNKLAHEAISKFDDKGNIIKVTYLDSNENVTSITENKYNLDNQLESERSFYSVNGVETLKTYSYDDKGRKIFKVIKDLEDGVLGRIVTESKVYDENDRVIEQKYIQKNSDNEITDYNHNTREYEELNGAKKEIIKRYDLDGNLRIEEFDTSIDNKEIDETIAYDPDGKVVSHKYNENTYSDNGMLISRLEQDFFKPELSRLTITTYENGYIETGYTIYKMDEENNLKKFFERTYYKSGEEKSCAEYIGENQLVSYKEFDLEGNVIKEINNQEETTMEATTILK